jgi:hypothetical protein
MVPEILQLAFQDYSSYLETIVVNLTLRVVDQDRVRDRGRDHKNNQHP